MHTCDDPPADWQPDWMFECRICEAPITSCELCEECAEGNDPFVSSKYAGDTQPTTSDI